MTNKHNPKFQELVAKLREIFQIDRPELDFGIYRILNARAGEINDYLENRLAEKVQAALSAGSAVNAQQLQVELNEAVKQAESLGENPDEMRKVKELRAKLKEATAGSSEHENAVFSHLLTFFSRYYEQGDFISQRRYKGDTYAIPYAGEEVMLHWANKDQYYTKSGENFSNYSFKLEDGRTVHFRLAAADTAKDNRKDNDKERRFSLVEEKIITRVDENGDEYEEELVPVEEASSSDNKQELTIRFEYAAYPKSTKQEALVKSAVEIVLNNAVVKERWLALGKRAPTEKSPQRTLLEKHLTDYTTKNTADYFIHKDLGGFLRRELDFYIKNEVMHLDDVQNAGTFADIEKNLRMIQCLRSIALELITFLAQLEDFQKKLWLKKKFVVSSHYCITLDRVPEALYSEIAANEKQWAQWKQLGVWDGDAPGTVENLKAAQYRMVDTSLFDQNFTNSLLAARENLDADQGGLVVHGDNFQAMKLIQERYRGQVDAIYIDPPYNTGSGDFFYKDHYKSSSWLAMLRSRIDAQSPLMCPGASMFMSIDEIQMNEAKLLLDSALDSINIVSVKTKVAGVSGSHHGKSLKNAVEYILCYTNDITDFHFTDKVHDKQELVEFIEEMKAEGKSWKYTSVLDEIDSGQYVTSILDGAGGEIKIFRHDQVSVRSVAEVARTDFGGDLKRAYYEKLERVFRTTNAQSSIRQRVIDASRNLSNEWISITYTPRTGRNAGREIRIYYKDAVRNMVTFLSDVALKTEDGVYKLTNSGNLWADIQYNNLASEGAVSFENGKKPISLVGKLIDLISDGDETILDYFAGSGTTGHALISANRKDGNRRKYILVEQGEYFDDVLKARLQKVVYSDSWRSGNPASPETGISHCFKVLKLESYEDTLNNLQLRRTSAQGDLLNTLPQQAKDDYLLNYLLDVESRGSLLSVEDFKKPFDYTLNVAVDSAGAFEPRKIDLVETFNYLIGLRVKHIDAQPQRGFVTVTGTLPSGESCLVLWRDCDVLDYEGISKLCDKLAINPADNEFDVVYINGDHNIPTVLTQTAEEGGATRVLKLRQIEPEFLERMFSVEDV